MKRWLCLALLAVGSCLHAQYANVTATARGSDGQTWSNGTVQVTFVPPTGYNGKVYTFNGASWVPTVKQGSLSPGGVLNVTNLERNDYIQPSGSRWKFTICPGASLNCDSVGLINVNRATLDISSQLNLQKIRFPASQTNRSFGYADLEVSPVPPNRGYYFNANLKQTRVWDGAQWNSGDTGSQGPQGQPGSGPTPAGNSQEVQINSNGNTGPASGVTYNGLGGLAGKSFGGIAYAGPWQTPPNTGNNGIVNAMASNSTTVAEPTYSNTEQPFNWRNLQFPTVSRSHLSDQRQGHLTDVYTNPGTNGVTGQNDAHDDVCAFTSTGASNRPYCHSIYHWVGAPGVNYGYGNTTHTGGATGVGWTVAGSNVTNSLFNSPGISQEVTSLAFKAGIGDSTPYEYHWGYGGAVAGSDEGQSLQSLQGGEYFQVYQGTTNTITNAQNIRVDCNNADYAECDHAGDGRYLVDLTKALTGFSATGITRPTDIFVPGYFTTTPNVPSVSTFWGTLGADVRTPQPNSSNLGTGTTNMAMTFNAGTLNGIVNPGPPAVGDLICFAGMFHEQARITSVTGAGPWTVQANLRHAHESGSWVFANGMCGYFIDFAANDVTAAERGVSSVYGTLHYPSDILGSINSSTIVYRYFRVNDNTNTLLGRVTFPIQEAPTSYFQNDGAGNVWISQASQVGQPQVIGQPNLYLTVLAGQDKAFNGLCANSHMTAGGKVICTQTASNGHGRAYANTVSIGTSPYGNTQFVLYPGAEVLDVLDYNQTTCLAYTPISIPNGPRHIPRNAPCLDGTFALEPNVGFSVGDKVENAHHYATIMRHNYNYMSVYNPMMLHAGGMMAISYGGAGFAGGNPGNPTGDIGAATFVNGNPASMYVYHGGLLRPPSGVILNGVYGYGISMYTAPESALLWAGCPANGCSDPGFTYSVFNLGGGGQLNFTPSTVHAQQNFSGGVDMYYSPLERVSFQSNKMYQGNSSVVTYWNATDSGNNPHTYSLIAPSSGGTNFGLTFPQKSGTIAVAGDSPTTYWCGNTNTCAMSKALNAKMVGGVIQLTSGAATLTGLPFSASNTYICTCMDTSTTPTVCGGAIATASTFKFVGTGSDTIYYQCFGY